MFDAQGEENGGWATKEKILTITQTVPGIDTAKVGILMIQKQSEYMKAIEADRTEGEKFGINGTPGMIIDSQFINGAQDYSVYKQLIDSLLK